MKRWLNHDPQFIKYGPHIDTFSHRLSRLPEFQTGHLLEALHQRTEGAKILVASQLLIAAELGVNDGNCAAYIPDLMT